MHAYHLASKSQRRTVSIPHNPRQNLWPASCIISAVKINKIKINFFKLKPIFRLKRKGNRKSSSQINHRNHSQNAPTPKILKSQTSRAQNTNVSQFLPKKPNQKNQGAKASTPISKQRIKRHRIDTNLVREESDLTSIGSVRFQSQIKNLMNRGERMRIGRIRSMRDRGEREKEKGQERDGG